MLLGDEISIGGFQRFVHKKEVDRETTLEFKFDTDAIRLNGDVVNNVRTLNNSNREKPTEPFLTRF